MKKISIILMAVAFAATGISAKAKVKKNAAQIECEKKAKEALTGAAKSKASALKECSAKRGKERTDCRTSASNTFNEAQKTHTSAVAECAKLSALPEVPAVPGAPAMPSVPGGK